MRKILILALLIVVALTLTGCDQIYFKDTALSLASYSVEKTEQTGADDNLTGYSYTLKALIKNDGREEDYSVKLEGKTSNATNYAELGSFGPIIAQPGENTIDYTVKTDTSKDFDNYRISLYLDGKLEDQGKY